MTNYNEGLYEILDELVEGCEDGRNTLGYRYDLGSKAKLAILQLIKEETVKARVEEINRIDEANKDNGINFFFEDMKPQNNGWRNMKQYVPDRIAQLKAELKQSNNKDT